MPIWVPIVAACSAGLLGLLAGLSSVFLTRRFTRQQKLDDRLEATRLEQRDALVDLIDAVNAWAPHTEHFAMLLAMEDPGSRESMKYLDTDSGREMLQLTKDLRRVLVRCLLTVVDEELRSTVLQIDWHFHGREAMHTELLREKPLDQVKASGVGMRYAATAALLTARLQDAAVRRLSTPPAPPVPTRRWWQRVPKP